MASLTTTIDLASHVQTLCSDNRITLEYRRSGGRAWRRTRRVSIAPVRSAITYAVALHEIGHILGRSPTRRLDREAAAWMWARQHAIQWTPAMDSKMKSCLDSYAKKFIRKWRRGVYMAPSATFDHLRGESLTMALPAFTKVRR